ncbi:MAG TPA: Maf family protein, partial [Bacillota bacterium]
MFLLLASSSPRRRDLLAQIGVEFAVVPSRVDEA